MTCPPACTCRRPSPPPCPCWWRGCGRRAAGGDWVGGVGD
jgi:hypothetical protein